MPTPTRTTRRSKRLRAAINPVEVAHKISALTIRLASDEIGMEWFAWAVRDVLAKAGWDWGIGEMPKCPVKT